MIINTESVVGYNNNLRRATDDMNLGVNNQVNQDTKKAGLKKMGGSKSKINPPNNHPSNQTHKQATEDQGLAPPSKQATTPSKQPATTKADFLGSPPASKSDTVDAHHVNKALVAVGALALVGVFIYSSS